MDQVKLHIETPDGEQTVSLDEELTIGRTDISQLVLADSGLSRKNTTFFRDGDDILVVDEGSTNGTFLNGDQISGPPRILRNGDELKIGSSTKIRVEFVGEKTETRPVESVRVPETVHQPKQETQTPYTAVPAPNTKPPTLVIAAGIMTFAIIFMALVAILIASRYDNSATVASNGKQPPPLMSAKVIPMRVIDPLGGENEEDLDDLIASWEVEEKEVDAATVGDVKVESANTDEADLNVTAAFLADRQAKSLEPRNGETGIRPAGLNVPKELFGDGVIKQKRKLAEMKANGYRQPLDFGDLAEKRLKKELIEMPMAAKSYYLSVGGSAGDGVFMSFAFPNVRTELTPGNPKHTLLSTLAGNLAGQKYDLNDPSHRKQIRVRLLRMFNARAKPILLELAEHYYAKYNRPLRVTSLTRSMDYQIGLNATNANSFKVRDENALPPHTSGCAFDLARKHMTAEEQNYVMAKLAQMENENKLDALIEYGENACWHVFIYSDGLPPK
ncbi:MAG: FHA domain-containing protein [Pyrinomonadaceae bacterium]|nr:FHA domain-containing protein [Acidobacteriota bacterium]